MLLDKTVCMAWNPRNIRRYKDLGYVYTKMKDKFDVKVEHLPDYSQAYVHVKCDYCGKEFVTKWSVYKISLCKCVKKDCCSAPNCTGAKSKETIVDKYGADGTHNVVSDARRAATNLERYGSENVFASNKIKERIAKTNIAKYGVPSSQQNPEVRAKTRATCLKKYGVENYVELFAGKFIKENSPVWKGGVEYSRAERATHEYIEWRKSVFARDHYICMRCGASSCELHAHHIRNWKDNVDCRYDVDNGITLCSDCHYAFHSLYGKSNNTSEQLFKFLDLDEKIC